MSMNWFIHTLSVATQIRIKHTSITFNFDCQNYRLWPKKAYFLHTQSRFPFYAHYHIQYLGCTSAAMPIASLAVTYLQTRVHYCCPLPYGNWKEPVVLSTPLPYACDLNQNWRLSDYAMVPWMTSCWKDIEVLVVYIGEWSSNSRYICTSRDTRGRRRWVCLLCCSSKLIGTWSDCHRYIPFYLCPTDDSVHACTLCAVVSHKNNN